MKAAVADRYVLERELGRGGMATVYLAYDLRHERQVALKFLSPEFAASLGPARFLREIRLAAGLVHPHIVPVYDSGDGAGFLYYVMPVVEGESLRDRLRREPQLPENEAVQIAREIADALAYAHSHGILHRDIKPENILFEAGHAVLSDFGIARAVSSAGGTQLTETGILIGTPAYMSPEQVSGTPDLDGRSDVYSLGCVLYEMLAGKPPFTGTTALEILGRHANDPVPSLRAVRDGVPDRVEDALLRALAKVPAERFATATEFAGALSGAPGETSRVRRPSRRRWRRIALVGLMLPALLVSAAYGFLSANKRALLVTLVTRPAPRLDPRRIIVAPFENRTADQTLNALGEMAADWISRELIQSGEFDVVDERTALATLAVVDRIPRVLRNSDLSIALAQETGSGRLIAGAIYGMGDSLRVETRLIDVASGRVLRVPDPVSGSRRAPSALVEATAQPIMAALALAADTTVIGAAVRQPPPFEAYKEASRGWESWFRGDLEGFFSHATRATRVDSTFMMPFLMQAFGFLERFMWAEAEPVVTHLERHRDRLSAGEGLALDAFRASLNGDLPGRLRAAQEMLHHFPASAEAPLLVAHAAGQINHPRDALVALARTDPRRGLNLASPVYWYWRSAAFHQLGDLAQALDAARRGQKQFPGTLRAQRGLVRALGALGRARELETILRRGPPPVRPSRYEMTSPIYAPNWHLFLAIRELRAHGHEAEAERLAARVLGGPSRNSVDTARAVVRYVHGALLYERGRWAEAQPIFKRLIAEDSIDVRFQCYLGAIAARLGDRAEAEEVAAALARRSGPYLLGANTFGQARIAALMGDREQAVQLLGAAFAQGQTYDYDHTTHEMVHGHPDFKGMHDYPPFQQLMTPQR